MANFAAAARNYNGWKTKNNPNYKPWLRTDQNTLPLAKSEDFKSSPMLDENLSRKLDSEAHALAAPHDDSFD
jgi:hypothetical protein